MLYTLVLKFRLEKDENFPPMTIAQALHLATLRWRNMPDMEKKKWKNATEIVKSTEEHASLVGMPYLA